MQKANEKKWQSQVIWKNKFILTIDIFIIRIKQKLITIQNGRFINENAGSIWTET
jgi:hypothetical protein